MIRILFVSNLYPPHELGGWEQNCQEIVARLRARGHDCHVLTSRYGVGRRPPAEDGISRTLHLQANVEYYRPLDYMLRRRWRSRANRLTLHRALDALAPDVVFIWGMWNLSHEVAYRAERWLPGRVAYAVASYWPMEPDADTAYWSLPANHAWAERLKSLARKSILPRLARESRAHRLEMEHVACVSAFVCQKLLDAQALPHGARIINNGIDPTPFLAATGARSPGTGAELRLVYTGGILPHKGVHTAIEALGLLQQRGQADGVRLELIGGGHPDYMAQLQRRVGELGLADRITFRGRVPRDEIPGRLARADVFLFTSLWEEPIARSAMEAMAAGLAVIGTPVGGQREMLEHGVNALVYPPDDAAALAACVQRLRDDRALCARLGDAGRRTVLERYTLDRMADEMERWLEQVAAQPVAPQSTQKQGETPQ